MKKINLIKIFFCFLFFQSINASVTRQINTTEREYLNAPTNLMVANIDFSSEQEVRQLLVFNCGHDAIRLYDELIHGEIDLTTAFLAAIEFYYDCIG